MMQDLFFETISNELFDIINRICKDSFFNQFRLFGGTALSLQIGHRISEDADFISEKEINNEELINHLMSNYSDVKDIRSNNLGVFLKIGDIKVDFLSWNKPFIRNEVSHNFIRLMHIEEIATHKIFTIQNQDEKKDYIDIAALLRIYSLSQLIGFYGEKYNNSNKFFLVKYLISFSDIDNQPMPKMLNSLKWEDVKSTLLTASDEMMGK